MMQILVYKFVSFACYLPVPSERSELKGRLALLLDILPYPVVELQFFLILSLLKFYYWAYFGWFDHVVCDDVVDIFLLIH